MKKLMEYADGIRWGVYAITLLGTPLVAYANSKGWIGKEEVQLWAAEVAAASTLATAHVRSVVRNLREAGRITSGSSGRIWVDPVAEPVPAEPAGEKRGGRGRRDAAET